MTNTDRIIKNYWKVLEGDQRGTEIRAEFAVGKLLLIGKNCELMTFLLGVLQTPLDLAVWNDILPSSRWPQQSSEMRADGNLRSTFWKEGHRRAEI